MLGLLPARCKIALYFLKLPSIDIMSSNSNRAYEGLQKNKVILLILEKTKTAHTSLEAVGSFLNVQFNRVIAELLNPLIIAITA